VDLSESPRSAFRLYNAGHLNLPLGVPRSRSDVPRHRSAASLCRRAPLANASVKRALGRTSKLEIVQQKTPCARAKANGSKPSINIGSGLRRFRALKRD
jgi:hypothetical protein